MKYIDKTKEKLLAIDCLKVMKEAKTFRELSKELKLPAGVLNRYINGNVLPKEKRTKEIIGLFMEKHFNRIISEQSFGKKGKYVVTSDILANPFLMRLIAFRVSETFNEKIDRVMTAAADGIPLAVIIADFFNAKSIYAKSTQELSLHGHYTSFVEEKPLAAPFFLSKNLLRKNDRVLIVDDVIRGGSTLYSLTSICRQAKAELVGIFSIFMTQKAYKKFKGNTKVSYLFLLEG